MIELLSPAGDYECLESAVDYGADAVYLGSTMFGMRAAAAKFDFDTLKKGVEYAHNKNVKVYLTCNIVPSNEEVEMLPEFIRNAYSCGIDAAIVSDIGALSVIKNAVPELSVHISTQAGVVNYVTANELYRMGADRIVLAREVDIDNIKRIRDKIPADMDIEAFVHGAMCVSFSGRCLLSSFMVDRNANKGECAQPCRWKYHLVEEKRPGEYYELFEDDRGSYILNAKDMCMIEHLDKLRDAGVTSFKIEGRAKSAYYVAVVTNAYRAAMDAVKNNEAIPQWAIEEVYKVSHRQYCTGFYLGKENAAQYYENSGYIRDFDFVGVVNSCENGIINLTQRNYFTVHDELEILAPGKKPVRLEIPYVINSKGEKTEIANRATENLQIESELVFPPHSILRKPVNK
ncbi:MAG: U32 family peptidase [Ruminiclostridium sp.]|nr:U32 family peptidase [Ruminiclostridium sp.]